MKTDAGNAFSRSLTSAASRSVWHVAAPFTGASEASVSETTLMNAQVKACGYKRRWSNQLWRYTGGAAAVSLLLLSGCLYKRVVWSPDGNRAAVISGEDLYLCDTNGRLTSVLVSNVGAVAWLNDSQGLVLWHVRDVKDWAAISNALGRERAGAMAKEAESIWQKLQSGVPWSEATMNLGDKTDLVKFCLRDRHAVELRAKLNADEWKDLESKTVHGLL